MQTQTLKHQAQVDAARTHLARSRDRFLGTTARREHVVLSLAHTRVAAGTMAPVQLAAIRNQISSAQHARGYTFRPFARELTAWKTK